MRDFTEYRYKSTLERELGLTVCRLWSLPAEAAAAEALASAIASLSPALLDALRQALR